MDNSNIVDAGADDGSFLYVCMYVFTLCIVQNFIANVNVFTSDSFFSILESTFLWYSY